MSSEDQVLATPGSPGLEDHGSILVRPWIHVLMLGACLFALLPFLDNGYPAVVDEAVYSYQAANLADGSWASPRPLPKIDVDGWHGPLIDSITSGDAWIPYARQPLYPVLLTPFYKVAGQRALLILSVLGTWVAAISAMGIARKIDPPCALPTLWLTGLGTPLLFDAYIVVGHSIAAALAGACTLALIGACGLGRGEPDGQPAVPSPVLGLLAVVAAVLLVLVRSEGSLLVGALAVTGSFAALSIGERFFQFDWRRLWPPIAIGVAGVAAYILNGEWVSAITGREAGIGSSIDRVTDPANQVWVSLIRPWGLETRDASASMLLAAVCVLLAAVLLRSAPRRPYLGVLLLAGGAIATIARQFEEPDTVSGLLPAMLAVTFGLLLVGRSEIRRPSGKVCLGTSALTALGILWFAYGEGGAAEWGGRFFHVVIPLLVPVSVAAIARHACGLERRPRWIMIGALVAVTVSTSVLALRVIDANRDLSIEVVRETTRITRSLPDGSIVAVATVNPTGLSRLFWNEIREGYPILNGGNLATFTELLPSVGEAGGSEVVLITDTHPDNVQYVINKVLDRLGDEQDWKVTEAELVGDSGYVAVTIEKQ